MKYRAFAISCAFFLSTPALAFGILGYRWENLSVGGTPLCWAVDPTFPSGFALTQAELEDLVTQAAAFWESVSTSYVTFQKCAMPSGSAPYPGSNTVVVSVVSELTPNGGVAAGEGGCAHFATGGPDPFLHCDSAKVLLAEDSLIVGDAYTLTVIAHELGHVLGLAHSDRPSIMSYHRQALTLTSDDWIGLTYIYPRDGGRDQYAPLGCATVSSSGSGGRGPRPPGPESMLFPVGALLLFGLSRLFSVGARTGTYRARSDG